MSSGAEHASRQAEGHLRRGDEALAAGRRLTAGDAYSARRPVLPLGQLHVLPRSGPVPRGPGRHGECVGEGGSAPGPADGDPQRPVPGHDAERIPADSPRPGPPAARVAAPRRRLHQGRAVPPGGPDRGARACLRGLRRARPGQRQLAGAKLAAGLRTGRAGHHRRPGRPRGPGRRDGWPWAASPTAACSRSGPPRSTSGSAPWCRDLELVLPGGPVRRPWSRCREPGSISTLGRTRRLSWPRSPLAGAADKGGRASPAGLRRPGSGLTARDRRSWLPRSTADR